MTGARTRRWTDLWNAYWFPTTTTRNLAISRIVAVATQLLWFLPRFASLPEQINYLEKNSEFMAPQLIIRAISAVVPRELFFTPSAFTALYGLTVVAGIAALIGFFTRTALFVSALGSWILIAHKYSYADVHHPEALFAIFLLILAFSPSGESLSIDALLRRRRRGTAAASAEVPVETAMWPLKLMHVLLAMTYFSTGITKVLSGGLEWINGYTLQGYLFQDAIPRDMPLGIWMAQHHDLAIVASVLTILFEVFFFVSLIVPRTAPFFFIGGVFFHLTLFVTGRHPFFPHIVLLLLLLFLLDPNWRRTRENLSRPHNAGAAGPVF
jgi:uncharacterized membrane protein YphA (DoxX/SURF4 family)